MVQRTQYVFWRGLCEYFVLAVIKAAIILVINFNAAHARKRENERFDKRAVSPPFVLPSCFTLRHYSFTPQHLLQDILLNPTSNQGIHARSEFYTSDTFKTDKNKQNRTLSRSFFLYRFFQFLSLFLWIFSNKNYIFLSVYMFSYDQGSITATTITTRI